MSSIRISRRAIDAMLDTGWGSGSDEDGNADPVRVALRAALRGPTNADRSVTIRNPDRATLGRLYFEGDHMQSGMKWGDPDPDNLADYNAGAALMRRVQAVDPSVNAGNCREIMYADDSCIGDPSHQYHSHDDDEEQR